MISRRMRLVASINWLYEFMAQSPWITDGLAVGLKTVCVADTWLSGALANLTLIPARVVTVVGTC